MSAAANLAVYGRLLLIAKLFVWEDSEGKSTALLWLAVYHNLTAVCLYDSATEVQAQTGAAYLRPVTMVTVKFIENMGQYAAFYPHAKVLDACFYESIAIKPRRKMNFWCAVRILYGVVEQVA